MRKEPSMPDFDRNEKLFEVLSSLPEHQALRHGLLTTDNPDSGSATRNKPKQ